MSKHREVPILRRAKACAGRRWGEPGYSVAGRGWAEPGHSLAGADDGVEFRTYSGLLDTVSRGDGVARPDRRGSRGASRLHPRQFQLAGRTSPQLGRKGPALALGQLAEVAVL